MTYRKTSVEVIRGDIRTEDNLVIGTVTDVNTVAGTLNARSSGDVAGNLLDVYLVGDSIANVEIGDKVALARFSGRWLALGVIKNIRRDTEYVYGLEVKKDLVVRGDLVVYGNTTTYETTYQHGGTWSP